jgi:hypothetical protein
MSSTAANQIGSNSIGSKLAAWLNSTCRRTPLIRFRIAFALIWLSYDILDLFFGGTRGFFWAARGSTISNDLAVIQVILIFCQLGMIFGPNVRAFTLAAFAARGFECLIFHLNDFFYYSVTALILSQCDCDKPKTPGASDLTARAWPRDIFILQTAWIYFATALLKLGPTFLSGGDLFVRQTYMEASGWPYPEFYRNWIATLSHDSILAWLGVLGEMSLSIVLFAWLYFKTQRRWLRWAAISIVVGIHSFGALCLNVFFFSLSMVAQVIYLTQTD